MAKQIDERKSKRKGGADTLKTLHTEIEEEKDTARPSIRPSRPLKEEEKKGARGRSSSSDPGTHSGSESSDSQSERAKKFEEMAAKLRENELPLR